MLNDWNKDLDLRKVSNKQLAELRNRDEALQVEQHNRAAQGDLRMSARDDCQSLYSDGSIGGPESSTDEEDSTMEGSAEGSAADREQGGRQQR